MKRRRKRQAQRSIRSWVSIFIECNESPLNAKEYCQESGISYGQFTNAKSDLKKGAIKLGWYCPNGEALKKPAPKSRLRKIWDAILGRN